MLRLSLIIALTLGGQSPTFHFAIPPGPLDAAIAAFHIDTGLTVTLPVAADVGSLPSPGVTGDLTADAALDQLLAGLPLAARRSTAGGYALDFQIAPEKIDVVGRAPAAVLFGRGGAGGVVNVVPAGPSRTRPSEATIDLGSFDHKRATFRAGGGLTSAASYGVSVMAEDSGGFRDAFFLRRYGINPTIGVEVGRSTRLTAGVEHLVDHRLADRGIPSRNGRPLAVTPSQLFGSPSQNDAQSGVDGVTLAL